MTFAAWVKITAAVFPNGYTNWELVTNEVYNSSGFKIRVDGETAKLFYRSNQAGAYQQLFSNTALTNNTWYHVAVVKSGTTITFYVNGSADGSGTVTSPAAPTSNFFISQSGAMDGFIDDLRVYGRALSA